MKGREGEGRGGRWREEEGGGVRGREGGEGILAAGGKGGREERVGEGEEGRREERGRGEERGKRRERGKALKDIKTESKQTAAYIRHFHERPKSCRSHLKTKVSKIVGTFMNFLKKKAKSLIHSKH